MSGLRRRLPRVPRQADFRARRTRRLPREDPHAEVGEDVRVGVSVGPMEFQFIDRSIVYARWRSHAVENIVASLDLHATTLTLSLIITPILQPYPNPHPTNSNPDHNHADPNPKP